MFDVHGAYGVVGRGTYQEAGVFVGHKGFDGKCKVHAKARARSSRKSKSNILRHSFISFSCILCPITNTNIFLAVLKPSKTIPHYNTESDTNVVSDGLIPVTPASICLRIPVAFQLLPLLHHLHPHGLLMASAQGAELLQRPRDALPPRRWSGRCHHDLCGHQRFKSSTANLT